MPSASWKWRLPLRFDIIVFFHFEVLHTHTHTRTCIWGHTHTGTPSHALAEINLWHMSIIYGARSYFGCQSGSAAVNKDWQPACGQGSVVVGSFFGFFVLFILVFGLIFLLFFFFLGAAIAATIPFS